MNLSNRTKKLAFFLLLLIALPFSVFAQKLIKGEVNFNIYSFTHAENFPCGAGFGDIMKINLEVIGDIVGTETIQFKVWLDTPSNQNSSDLLIEYPTEVSTKNGQYQVDYLGRGIAGELNFGLTSMGAKNGLTLGWSKETNTNCLGVATLIINDMLMPNQIPTPMFGNCVVYFDVWLSNVYCTSNVFDYTMPSNGGLADNGECFQSTSTSRLAPSSAIVASNPFYGNLEVAVEENVQAIILSGVNGEKIYQKMVGEERSLTLPTEHLPVGIYLMTVIKEGGMETQKLLKS